MLIFYFFIGLAVGSFLNSVIYRLDLPARASARSYCPYCKKTLSWFELIPLMSFILQKGKCRHCRKPISLQYPLVELATGILFVLCGWYFFGPGPTSLGLVISTVFWLFVVSCLIIIFVYDLKHYIIPNQIVYSGIIIAVSVILIIFKKKTLKSEIPFGPFLAGATLVVIFWGNILINWYLNLLL